VTLDHDIRGDPGAPPVVLSSSLGTTKAMWDPQAGPLAERLRVIRHDHRGHGASPVPPGPYEIADLAGDVLALLDDLGVRRTSLVGLSLGGMVGMWLAAHAPERIDRLVLMCTAAKLGPPSLWAERAAAVREAGSTEPIADGVVDRWLTPAYAERHPDARARLRAMLAAQPPDGYAACCGAIERMDQTGDLDAIRAPTLVIAGAEDQATPLEHLERIAGGIPGARLEVLSPAAHVASVEQADAVNRLVLDHLAP
jgi:3-oxoadipate enol-lactonase